MKTTNILSRSLCIYDSQVPVSVYGGVGSEGGAEVGTGLGGEKI